MPFIQLPAELITSICEFAYYTEDFTPDRNTLRVCSLVCTDWRNSSQRLLFRSGHIFRNKQSMADIRSTFTTPRGQILGSYVRSLKIIIGQNTPASYSLNDFADILPLFPRLYDLSLITGAPEFGTALVAKLQEVASQLTIKSLEFHYTSNVADCSMLYQLFTLWPSITILLFGRPGFPPPPTHRPNFQLYELGYHRPPPIEVLDWLVPGHSLRVFNLRFRMAGPETTTFLEREGATLRSLRIPALNEYTSSWISKCPSLQEIYLENVQLPLLETTLNNIPTSVEHLLIQDIFGNEPAAVARIVQRLQSLSVLTISKDLEGAAFIQALVTLCNTKGVEISYDAPRIDWGYDDPVVVDRFPRGRSVDNFKLMN